MVPRKNRFTRSQFELIRPSLKAFRSGKFVFLWKKGARISRFSVVVSKKADGAPGRNRLRRQVYELFRLHILPLNQKVNLIGLYKGEENTDNKSELLQAVLHFKKFLLHSS